MDSASEFIRTHEPAFRELAYKWAMSWDRKDGQLFSEVTAPRVIADYTAYPAVGIFNHFTPEEYFKYSFAQERLGDPRCKYSPWKDRLDLGLTSVDIVQTQHLLGAAAFKKLSDTEATGDWQARARHVRHFPDGRTAEWDSSAYVEIRYVMINGVWKIGGLRPHSVIATTGHPQDVIGHF